MSNIQNECEIVSECLTDTLKCNPLSAAYMMGNLYYFLLKEKGEKKKLVEHTIKEAKKNLTKKQTQVLWDQIDKLTKSDWHVMPRGNKKSLEALRRNILRDVDYFKHIENDSLIKVGQNVECSREVFIALIRKHLKENKLTDQFANDKFNYELLATGGSEENHLYLYKFFKKCPSLPIKEIVSLGQKSSEISESILKDLSTTTHYFAVSAKIAKYHSNLRVMIAKDWKNILATHPLTSKQKETVQDILIKLKEKYREFKGVKLDDRPERVQPRGENELENDDEDDDLYPASEHITGGMIGATVGFGVPIAAVTCACPPLLALFAMAAVGAAGGYALSKSPTINRWERSARRKVGFH